MIENKISRENQVVIQHNYLIEARYNLSLQEKRLMYWLASQSKIDDENFKEHELTIKEFAKLVDIRGDHLYKDLKLITHKLMDKILTIQSLTDRSFFKAHMLSGAKYDDKSGILKLSFHPYLKPYMLQLKDRFTKISLGDILGLKSVHAIRIYEILKQYESVGTREIPLNELREYCGIDEGQYKKFNGIKRDVLERSLKEINEKTDIFIGYEEVKTSRKVTSIKFFVKSNPKYRHTEFEKSQQEKTTILRKELRSKNVLIEKIMEYGFSRPIAQKFFQECSEKDIENALKAVDIQVERKNVKNPKAMLRTAIKEKWNPEVFVNKKAN